MSSSTRYDAIERMAGRGRRVIAVDGNALAATAGSAKVAGVVLLGALSTRLTFAAETWEQAIANNVGAGWLEMNLAAFAAGRTVGVTPHGAQAAEAPQASAGGEVAGGGRRV